MKVALFVTCLTDTFYPRAGVAVVKVLRHLGCEVDFPESQTCCGQPFWNNGYKTETRKLARHMIEVFEEADHVITPSGSCCAMIRDYYGELFEDEPDWAKRAEALMAKTREFVEFLVHDLKVNLADLNCTWAGKATYHYSCHLRGIGMTDEAEQLIRQIVNLEYQPLDKKEQCCGFGGTFAVKYPEISGSMVRDKTDCITRTQAEHVISNDAGCTMNISGSCHREGKPQQFIHIAEVIAEGLGLLPYTGNRPQEVAR